MMSTQWFNRSVVFGIGAFAISGIGTAATFAHRRTMEAEHVRGRTTPKKYAKSRVTTSREKLAVFIVSSTCGGSQGKDLMLAASSIKTALSRMARTDSSRFVSIGVAVDESAKIGLEFLQLFGTFDEMMTGRGWLGMGSVDFLVRGNPAALTMPQLVLIERDVTVIAGTITVGPDRVVGRKVGADEIVSYAKSLTPTAQ